MYIQKVGDIGSKVCIQKVGDRVQGITEGRGYRVKGMYTEGRGYRVQGMYLQKVGGYRVQGSYIQKVGDRVKSTEGGVGG